MSNVLKILYYFCIEFYQIPLFYLLNDVILSFILFLLYIMWNDFQMLNQPTMLGWQPTWLQYIISIYCSIHHADTLFSMIVFMFMKKVVLKFSFLLKYLSGFAIKTMLASQNESGSIPLIQFSTVLSWWALMWFSFYWIH